MSNSQDIDPAPIARREVRPLDALSLELDDRNPRLAPDEVGSSQSELIQIFLQRFNLDELAESIIASGFEAFDPMIGWTHDGSVTILEGNRRLATIQLLRDPERAPPPYRAKWREYAARYPRSTQTRSN